MRFTSLRVEDTSKGNGLKQMATARKCREMRTAYQIALATHWQ